MVSHVSVLTPVRDYIDALVHPSVRGDAVAAARHRAFIAPRLLGGLTALAVFPLYLAVRGVPSALETFVFAWFVLPIVAAQVLSRTGRYDTACLLSALSLTGLVGVVAGATGGIASAAAIWLVVVPIEAVLSASRRIVVVALGCALAAAAVLFAQSAAGLAPVPPQVAAHAAGFHTVAIVTAALYASGLALATESIVRISSRLRLAEEARYRLLARHMSDVITRHGRNGAVLFASPAAEQLFATPARSLVGHGLFDRVHVADRPAFLTALSDAAAHGTARSVEFRVRREAGATVVGAAAEFVWVEMRCSPLERVGDPSADHESEVVAVMRDVSERKAQELAIEDARAEAEKANAAKSRFLATMSHELRTPLNAIIGFSEMLANEETMRLDVARRHDYATLINDSGHHLLSVVNGILDMSKIETGNFDLTPEPFTPGQVIGNCCDLLALKARENGIDLVIRLADGLPEIVADKRALKQILINLLSNAVKFTPRGGRITVGARLDGAEMVLAVEDTGVGIGEHDLPRLGDPFFQVRSAYDRPHDGTGLGLSIVKGLVSLHGGRIDIRSRLGVGTCVTVRLPIDCETRAGAPARVERIAAAPAPAPAARDAAVPQDTQVRKRA